MEIKQTILCDDGYPLHATVFVSHECRGKVVIGSALGIGHAFYAKLATFFAQNGLTTFCFDYRGTGESSRTIDGCNLQLSDWGRQDIEAVLQFAQQHEPITDTPIYFIGHSIGGQVFPLAASADRVKRTILVAASAPYWRRWPFPSIISTFISSRVILRLAANLTQDFPTARFGLGNLSIKSSLVREWCAWMGESDYLFNRRFNLDAEKDYSRYTSPVLSFGASDDLLAPAVNIQKLLDFYASTSKSIKIITPIDYDVKTIGHSGFFRSNLEKSLWQEMLSFLNP